MPFKAAFPVETSRGIPGRVYVHTDYKGNLLPFAQDHAVQALEQLLSSAPTPQQLRPDEMAWFVGFLWSNSTDPEPAMIDVFGYEMPTRWPGNATAFVWTLKDGVYVPNPRGVACEEEIQLAGLEAQYRKTTKDLEVYRNAPFLLPNINDLLGSNPELLR